MTIFLKAAVKCITLFGRKCLRRQVLLFLFTFCNVAASVNGNDKVFVQSTQGIKGFGGIISAPDGTLLAVGSPNVVRRFNPFTRKWEEKEEFTFPNYSFGDDLTLIPEGFATGGFLDGLVYAVLDDGTIIQSNMDNTEIAGNTGKFQQVFDPKTQGLNPITYRKSDDVLYMASAFNPFNIIKMNWQRSFAFPLPLDPLPPRGYGWNGWQFGPGDLLYSPDTINNQIIAINVDTTPAATVQTVIPSTMLDPLDIPIALKIDSRGNLFFIGRRTGHVFKWVIGGNANQHPELIATLEPALDNLCLSPDETKLYVTNDENKLVEIDLNTRIKKTLFESPIVLPWDIAYDPETKSVYVADFGSLKQFKASNAKLERLLIADTTTSGLAGIGTISGITVEQGPNAKIIMTDVTTGNIMAIHKNDLSVYKVFNTQDPVNPANTGTAFTQPFSTVRVIDQNKPAGEYYLTATPSIDFATSTTPGKIVKFWESPDMEHITNSDFFTGLWSPIKLKIYKGYVYVLEAGDLLNRPALSPGRVSRIALSNPSTRQILVDNLNNPQGLDIVDDKLYIVEAGTKRLLEASALFPSIPKPLRTDLDLSNETIIYQFGPIPILPPATVAIEEKGKSAFIVLTKPDKIIQSKL